MILVLLRIIVKIIAGLLLLLLFLLALLLAGPFFYDIQAWGTMTEPQSLSAVFRLTWMIFLGRLELRLDGDGLKGSIRLAGIRLDRFLPDSFKDAPGEREPENPDRLREAETERKNADRFREAETECKNTGRLREADTERKNTDRLRETEQSGERNGQKDKKGKQRKASGPDPVTVKESVAEQSESVEAKKADHSHASAKKDRRTAIKRIKRFREVLESHETKEALALIWSRLKKLFRHLFPKKAEGHAEFGFEDPSVTGLVTAVLAALLPVHRNRLSLEPDFTPEKKFSGQVMAQGRFFLAVILFHVLLILTDRNVRTVYRRLQKRGRDHL